MSDQFQSDGLPRVGKETMPRSIYIPTSEITGFRSRGPLWAHTHSGQPAKVPNWLQRFVFLAKWRTVFYWNKLRLAFLKLIGRVKP